MKKRHTNIAYMECLGVAVPFATLVASSAQLKRKPALAALPENDNGARFSTLPISKMAQAAANKT